MPAGGAPEARRGGRGVSEGEGAAGHAAPSGAKVRRSARRCEAGGGRARGRERARAQAWWCLVRRA